MDEDLPRFGLRVRASGTKTYVVQIHGRTRFVTLGHHGPVTPDHARKLALGILADVAAGRDPASIAGIERARVAACTLVRCPSDVLRLELPAASGSRTSR